MLIGSVAFDAVSPRADAAGWGTTFIATWFAAKRSNVMRTAYLAQDHRHRAEHWRRLAQSWAIAGNEEASAQCRRKAEMWRRAAMRADAADTSASQEAGFS
ncbi:hypothetical protein [Methylobacterium oxalidis]|uniref:Uncharacterized protein n=1 Tax=Methylobacterium oxalidis TaxID=944322 RepID=A0A512J465_9HYPH|nr:hypothetical protein [Methylobacterium oxalidis]GEP04797.1 hypothetical protein MOX02_28350 [Methylobacterium oxalidis]GJE30496.1 hypothetical protein LDDCCGHA_0664 [Methylobacterium oxalidis]GLS63623.1 hypothetical protein GCM10007888_20040 [Methylobacterium oxalidis]